MEIPERLHMSKFRTPNDDEVVKQEGERDAIWLRKCITK